MIQVTQNQDNQNVKQAYDVLAEGAKIGTKTISMEIERQVQGDNIIVNLVTETHYDLNDTATEAQKEVFSDNVNKAEIKKINNEYFVDGQKVDAAQSNQSIYSSNVQPNDFSLAASEDTGGRRSSCGAGWVSIWKL